MDGNIQERYLSLRKKLADMNYPPTVSSDNIDLVERILNDLVSTNESYRQVCEKEANLINDLSLAQAQLFPLKKENARLSKENYQLHLESIKQKDEVTKELNNQSLQVVHLEEKVKDLTFVLKSKEDALLSIEQEKNRIKEVII
jgi:hypothetical protein